MILLSGTGIENEEIGGYPEIFYFFIRYLVAPRSISGLLAAENPRKSAESRKFAENSRPWLLFINLLNFTLNCISNFRNTSLPLRNGFITPMGVITPRLRTTALYPPLTPQYTSKLLPSLPTIYMATIAIVTSYLHPLAPPMTHVTKTISAPYL